MNPFYIYLWGISDSLRDALHFGVFLATVGSFFAGALRYISDFDEVNAKMKWPFRLTITALIVFGSLASIIPSSKTIACMVILPKIAESQAVQKDLPELYDMAVEYLKSQLKQEKK